MYQFNVITWNTGAKYDRYGASVNNILSGGRTGHASAELIIPVTDENAALIQTLNHNNKLIVTQTTTLVPHKINTDPFSGVTEEPCDEVTEEPRDEVTEEPRDEVTEEPRDEVTEEPRFHYKVTEEDCFHIYFSFWGDARTVQTPERHRMVNNIKDRIEENEGIPFKYGPKAKEILGDEYFEERKWTGIFGHKISHKNINTIYHQRNHDDITQQQVKNELEALTTLEQQKQDILSEIKTISETQNKKRNTEQKEAYLNSPEVQKIYDKFGVNNFQQLKDKLSFISSEIKRLQQRLFDMNVQFGCNPDNVVSFTIKGDSANDPFDYKAILKEMAEIANNPLKYNAVHTNCSTAVVKIMMAGITENTKKILRDSGYFRPRKDLLFETPQSVYLFAQSLSTSIIKTQAGIKNTLFNRAMAFIKPLINIVYIPLVALIKPPLTIIYNFLKYLYSCLTFCNQQKKLSDNDEEMQLLGKDLDRIELLFAKQKIHETSYETIKNTLNDKINQLQQSKIELLDDTSNAPSLEQSDLSNTPDTPDTPDTHSIGNAFA